MALTACHSAVTIGGLTARPAPRARRASPSGGGRASALAARELHARRGIVVRPCGSRVLGHLHGRVPKVAAVTEPFDKDLS